VSNTKRFSAFFLALALSLGILFPITFATAAENKVDINAASLEQLEAVKGVGHDIAQNILAYKKENGAFKTFDDLAKVKGVGKVRLVALKEAFTLDSTLSTTGEPSAKK
jgi:competence protein ComEA